MQMTKATNEQLDYENSILVPQAIRSTAGLLYWFATETGLSTQSLPPIVSASIRGNNVIIKGKISFWGVSQIVEGIAKFHYSWYIKKISSGTIQTVAELSEISSAKNSKTQTESLDSVDPNALPTDMWVRCGQDKNYLELMGDAYDSRDFYLKCEVTDASGKTVTSNALYVMYTDSDLPPDGYYEILKKSEDTQALIEKSETENNVNQSPLANSLSNYPNPFNPSTTINYSVVNNGFVSLTVYDILGNKIAELVNEYKPAGNYIVRFDGSRQPSGIYICTIKSANYSATRKVLLVK